MDYENEHDLMERLVSEWTKECPDLDAEAMKIVGRIMRLGRRFEKEAAQALKPFKLPYTDFDIIATLRRSGPPYEMTPGQLGTAVLLTSGAMTAALDRLESANFITRHASQSDRRVRSARLTQDGQDIAAKAAKARFKAAEDTIRELPASKRQALANLLLSLSASPGR
ncbi:MAG: MarR family transcriptional regulator [Pseudomonadota bacterium]